jgi:hypothetical protein
MSQQKDDKANGSLGYQTKNNEEVNGIVERLNTPRKRYEPKNPDRRRKVCLKLYVGFFLTLAVKAKTSARYCVSLL